jgi:long-chain acyl-CoA synthetase
VNLADLLTRTAAESPERTAIVFDGTQMSYTQLDMASNQVANLLVARGIVPGDRVAVICPNRPEFTVIYFGILKCGATVVPLNILLKAHEIAYHLSDSEARALIAFEGSAELPMGTAAREAFDTTPSCTELILIEETPGPGARPERRGSYASLVADQPTAFATQPVDSDDTAVILYTSGTTGRPKGAELRHRNMRDNALASEEIFAVSRAHPDTYLCVLPLFHSFGQTVIQNSAVAFGGTVVMQPRFEAQAALTMMLNHQVTFFAGVPTMFWGLLGAAAEGQIDVSSIAETLRVAAAGGAALPAEIHRRFENEFGVSILEGYGLSETSPVASFAPWGAPVRIGSIGLPIRGVDMKLIQSDWADVPDLLEDDGKTAVGEIAIRGHNVMKGYYNRPEETSEAIREGWFRSGDLARQDADGYYYIVDRSKDMIIRGGYNVYPREVE